MGIIDDYANSSDDGKCKLLQDIEFEEVPQMWELIRSVVANKDEYDLARIQALKILELAALPEEELHSFGELLASVITTDEDYDVKSYAVIASTNFVNANDELKE